jgi:HAD superfamily hydrolase (TIGR01457 family)
MVARYDAVFLDLDGVVYRGDQAVLGAAEVLEHLRPLRPVVFLSNNSSRTPEEVAAKVSAAGVRARSEEVLTSALATASFLRRDGASGRTAFVIGGHGLRDALQSIGVQIVQDRPEHADLVVVGWDDSVDYEKLRTASLLVERGARLIATNADASLPAPDGLWPGAGAILAAITTTTGAVPTVIGKPARPLFEAAAEKTGAIHPLVVGDRLDTDIAGAAAMGWDSLMVLTGASTPSDLLRSDALPTYVAPDLSALQSEVPPARPAPARERDLPEIRALLTQGRLSADGAEDRIDGTIVLRTDAPAGAAAGVLVATACLEAVDGAGILRSVAVREDVRGNGIGTLAVAAAVREARRRDIATLALFTEGAASFFAGLGFERVERSELPEAVRAGRHAAEECPTAVPMSLTLRG